MLRSATPLKSQTRRKMVEQVAPRYRQASFAHKILLLNTLVEATGYARKYVIGLLNQTSERTQTIRHPRLPRYNTEVQNALFQAWKVTNWICAKRLIPFLPTLVDALERHEHLHLTEACRNHLLQVSPATAERLLSTQRQHAPHGLSTTKAGTLLKHQIPIRTFEQWDETRPGFLEADLVAHCGGQSEGSFLYTFTLTDIATGWTECLALLYRNPEAVQIALMHARTLFPFPILGIDTDNGTEFINKTILAYCEQEHLTFTRGRPEVKNDQCFIEQKNGAVVRQFVGHDRFVGEQVYQQLRELYRALHLYVNCFQPSMKLQSKSHDGERMRRVYDPAKTPLQRLLLSGTLSAHQQQELGEGFQALDPLDLFQQVERLQQALLHEAVNAFPVPLTTPSLLRFSSDHCFRGSLPAQASETDAPPPSEFHSLRQERLSQHDFLGWPRTARDPFEGEWEQILACVLAHPEYSSSDIFQKMLQQSPERYHPSQLSTLQHGVRKIRAHLMRIREEPWPQEVIQAGVLDPSESRPNQREHQADPRANAVCFSSTLPPQEHREERLLPHQPRAEEMVNDTPMSMIPVPHICIEPPGDDGSQALPTLQESHDQLLSLVSFSPMTIKQAVASYIQDQVGGGRSPKTMEWHQIALGLLQQYLVDQRQLGFLCQITESEVCGWFTFLRTPSLITGTSRRTSTIATYGRSARAFCHWAVQKGYLERTPMGRGILPKAEKKCIQLIEPAVFDRLLLACRPGEDIGASMDRVAGRNRAILWILFDTGMRASELCGLRLSDVDREQRTLKVEGRGKERWMPLSPNGWYQLLSYLEQYRPKGMFSEGRGVEEESLFLSETYQPLTVNALTLLFDRLRKRTGMTEKRVNPSLLRDTFAVHYLQAGGEPDILRDMLGLRGKAALKRYEQISVQKSENETQKEPGEEHQSWSMAVPQKSKRRRRRSSSRITRNHQPRGAGRLDDATRKEPCTDATEDA